MSVFENSREKKERQPWETMLEFGFVSGVGSFVIGFFAWWAYCYAAKVAGLPEVSFMESVGITMFLRHIALPIIGNFRPLGR